MYATAAGADTGVPKSVAREFVASDKPGKLPSHVKHAAGGGLGSPHLRLLDGGLASRPRLQGGGEFGGLGAMNPWWERSEARRLYDQPSGGGLIASSGAGRTDQLPMAVGTDSHVMPADVISGLGQGNTLNGARVLSAALRIGPYGVALPQGHHGPGPPRAPAPLRQSGYAEGGGTHDEHEKLDTSVLVAGGEMHVPRELWLARDDDGRLYWHSGVRAVGQGDLELGHKRLNDVISRVRKHTLNFLKNAPPPKS